MVTVHCHDIVLSRFLSDQHVGNDQFQILRIFMDPGVLEEDFYI